MDPLQPQPQPQPDAQPPVQPQIQPQPQPQFVQQPPMQPQVPPIVHVMHAVDPVSQIVSPEVQRKHDRSERQYPTLNLSKGEYIIQAVRRHPIGLVAPLALGSLILIAVLTLLLSYGDFSGALAITGPLANPLAIILPGILLVIVIAAAMIVNTYVYINNRFFLTNESVIQEIQMSLFSRREQTVSLANIEDASYTQRGILQYILNYGDVRLSTEGDETTYRFSYVANPKEHVAQLNNVVEAFKNGRAIDED